MSGHHTQPPGQLDALLARIRAFREARDWGSFHTPRNIATSIAVEAAELLEHFQWTRENEPFHDLDGIAEELADVAIYVLELADLLGLSLENAIVEKLAINDRRYPVAQSKGSTKKHSALR